MKGSMFLLALSFAAGVILSAAIAPAKILIIIALLLIFSAAFINRRNRRAIFYLMCIALCIFAMLYYSIAAEKGKHLIRFYGEKALVYGVVEDGPTDFNPDKEYIIKSQYFKKDGKIYNFTEKIKVKYYGNKKFKYGDVVKAELELSDIEEPRNPGDFNYKLYYKSQAIYIKGSGSQIEKFGENSGSLFLSVLYSARDKIREAIYKALPKGEASILYGIITGDKSGMDESTEEIYKKAGLAHILSVSGLHIGFIVAGMNFLLSILKLDKKLKGLLISIITLFYILIIGAPPPAVRAYIMLIVLLFGQIMGRNYNLIASISFAMLFMLIVNPLFIHNPGFAISFACMYSIGFLYEPIYNKLKNIPVFLRAPLSLSISVQLGIIPVLVYYFNYISLVSIFINVIAVPISFVITLTGFVGVASSLISHMISVYILSVNYYLINTMTYIAEKTLNFPFAGLFIPAMPFYMTALYYFLLLYIADWFGNRYYSIYKRRIIMTGISVAIAALIVYNMPSNFLKAVFFDVGQGDCALIITPERKTVLIDSGGSPGKGKYYFDVGGRVTTPALLKQGLWKINFALISHVDDDHMEGMLKILKVYNVDNIIFPKTPYVSGNYIKLLRLCRQKGIKIIYLKAGDRINVSRSTYIDILWPDTDLINGTVSDENNNSLVAKLIYKNFSILFTGDLGIEGENRLLAQNIRATILKVAHHGSAGSSSAEFLSAVAPKCSVISVGKNNYGHPSVEVVNRIEKCSSIVIRTDRAGAVTVRTDGNSVKIKTVKSGKGDDL